ncbi:MAG: hypothetical protein ACTSWC_09780 [Promethearchaeota archaeon]
MRVLVKFRSNYNVVWGSEIAGYKAFAYVKGFPATFFLTERRAIVVGNFSEKIGWFRKKVIHRIIFEASLEYVKEFKMKIDPPKKIFTAFLSFHPHGQLQENSVIQFLKIQPKIGKVIEDYVKDLKIKNPVLDSGIVLVDEIAPPIQEWLNKRFGNKLRYSNEPSLQL